MIRALYHYSLQGKTMKRISLGLTLLATSITTCWATESPPEMLGNLKASLHQTCGKNIAIQLAEMEDEHTLIGLKNNKTGKLDLFISASVNAENKHYDEYQPVKFDSLAKTFIADSTDRPSIVWGGAVSNLKGMTYTLALGTYIYNCDSLSPFKGEIANDLYGDGTSGAN